MKDQRGTEQMFFKPKKTGINFLCDAIILPQYFNFEREFNEKYPSFKRITFDNWSLFTAVYFTYAIQYSLRRMELPDYIRIMTRTVNYFETQYPRFRSALASLMNVYRLSDDFETHWGIWLAENFLQIQRENLSANDICMGKEIAGTIVKLTTVVNMNETVPFYCALQT